MTLTAKHLCRIETIRRRAREKRELRSMAKAANTWYPVFSTTRPGEISGRSP